MRALRSRTGHALRLAIVAATALALLVGCKSDDGPVTRIAETYGYGASGHTLPPMVIVPGFLGSTLVDRQSGHEIWGLFLAGEQRIGKADVQRRIALPMSGGDSLAELRDGVEPTGIFANGEVAIAGRRFVVNAYPGLLLGILRGVSSGETKDATPSERELRKSVRDMQSAPRPPQVHGVAYDWRRDLSESTRELDEAVAAAYQQNLDRGLRGEAARVDVVAHSMGTLVTRYYLRYGTQPLLDSGALPSLTWQGASRVRRAILIAPPNNGSLEAFRDITHGGSPQRPIPSHPAAVLGTFVSLYQMMPHPDSGAVVYADDGSPVDFYDVETWMTLGWGPFGADQAGVLANLLPDVASEVDRRAIARRYVALCLARARQLNAALDVPARPPPGTTLHLFAGDRVDTDGRIEIDPATGALGERHHEPGDRTVTRRSALGELDRGPSAGDRLRSPVHWTSVHFVDGDHLSLVGSATLLNDLLYLLLQAPVSQTESPTAFGLAPSSSGTPERIAGVSEAGRVRDDRSASRTSATRDLGAGWR